MSTNTPSLDGIAVIGMAGRFPGARDLDAFWRNLCDGVESISFFSEDELRAAGVPPHLLADSAYVRARAVLDDAELFDAAFFGLNPREAEILDPQHRLFLETAWEALEAAGYDPERWDGSIGVYAGSSMNTYLLNVLLPNRTVIDTVGAYQTMLGNDKDFLATRVAYKLGLRGPSLGVQTACSTSLVAVQLACQSLLGYQCDMALAGGVSVRAPRKAGYLYQEGMILSPDGHCRAFDARAQGTLVGEGVGVVVLKRLADALASGDFIHAVIRGAAVNNDGSGKVGYTAPGVEGQAEVIALAQAMAGVDPGTITYVEAHGTGTALGDPIEVAALTRAFRAATDRTGFCALGSVKTNIGHLDAAAGVAGLIKTVLALRHGMLPPSLHFERPNPAIDFARSPFYVNTRLVEWTRDGMPRRAGVSSFGIGGTNAHVVLEEAPPRDPGGPAMPWKLLVLSARTPSALDRATANLAEHLGRHPDIDLDDVAYTLQAGRRAFAHRRFAVVCDTPDAVAALAGGDPQRLVTGAAESAEASVVFMFPGQGAQHARMAHDLYGHHPLVREVVDRCAAALRPHLGADLREILYPPDPAAPECAERLRQTAVTQPALFVIEYALARWWMACGVEPRAMIGHSIGEYVAACLAGVLSLEDALDLVAARGRMMQDLPPGAMLAVPLAEADVLRLLGPRLSVAAVNGPALSVASGPEDAVAGLEARLAASGVICRHLHTSHAFHSAMMDPIVAAFAERVRRVPLEPPRIPFVSNVTGTWITAAEATDPAYWARHLRETVRFADGVQALLAEGDAVLLEVGPGSTLGSLVRQHPARARARAVISSLPRPGDRQSDLAYLLQALGRLWVVGGRTDWTGLHGRGTRRRVPLPTYPFERRRFWVEPGRPVHDPAAPASAAERRPDVGAWFSVPSWKRSVVPRAPGRDARAGGARRWLVFADECGLGRQLASRLDELGRSVVSVEPGTVFGRAGHARFTLDPGDRSHYAALVEALGAGEGVPDRIVHCWSVTAGPASGTDGGAVDRAQALGFYSLLYLAQALGEHPDPLHLDVVSNHLHDVTGGEPLRPEKASVLGPCRVIPREYAGITCRSIDVDLDGPPGRRGSVVERLLAEVDAPPVDPVVAYRRGHRWVATWEPVRLEPAAGRPALLRDRGVYLITGGLGGIGLVLADYLARTVKARLVLVARTRLPERERWKAWLATHPEDRASRAIQRIRALEASGAEVFTVDADVTDRAAMRRALARALERFGGIHGVIHAAGVPGGGIIALKTEQAAARVLAPKVAGTLVLDALLEETVPDFLLLCSSITSIAPPAGQVDYCAANAFLDAFARARDGRNGTRVIAVNWDTWREVGMAVDTPVPPTLQRARQEALERGIRSSEGADAFARILDRPLPQVVVCTRDIHEVAGSAAAGREPERPAPAPAETSADAAAPEGPARYSRPEGASAYQAPATEAERAIAEIWQELLGIDRVGVYDNFFDLGGHSLLATQVLARVEKALGVRLNRTDLMFQTLGQLAAACGERRPAAPPEPKGLLRRLFSSRAAD